MKINLSFLFVLLFFNIIHAQEPVFEWAKSVGGNYNDGTFSLVTDSVGNSYITGYFRLTSDFDPSSEIYNLTSNGDGDIFILKLDPEGDFLWAKAIGGEGGDIGSAITLDAMGYVYVTGLFRNTIDFDSGEEVFNLSVAGNGGDVDAFVLKLDSDGNFIWAKSMEGIATCNSISIITDTEGNVYSAGRFEGLVDFDPSLEVYNLSSFGGADVFVQKLSSNGDFIWAKSLGGTLDDGVRAMTLDNIGNVLVTGYYRGVADFDSGNETYNLTSEGDVDGFVVQMDLNGNFIWANSLGGESEWDDSNALTTDNFRNVYVAGRFKGPVDFDPSEDVYDLGVSSVSVFIAKYDSDGNFIWVKSMKGSSYDYNYALATDDLDDVYLVGGYRKTVDFDLGPEEFILSSTGNYVDVFVAKYDSEGDFIWVKSVGNFSYDIAYTVSIDVSRNIYLGGVFEETLDFNPNSEIHNLTSAGHSDIFVLKLSQCVSSFSTIPITACDNYTSPSGNQTWSTSGIYLDTIPNLGGCDSIITIDLTINEIDTIVNYSDNTLTAVLNDASYQWLDCDDGYSPIIDGVNQIFVPTVDGNYAVEITQNGCVDTSACHIVMVVGVLENDFDTKLLLYPNSTSGKFTIELGKVYNEVKIVIRNVVGKELKTEYFGATSVINTRIDATAGFYLVEIYSTGDKSAVLKILKE